MTRMHGFAMTLGIVLGLLGLGGSLPARAEGAGLRIAGGLTRWAVVEPGALLEGRITAYNDGDAPLEVKATLADYQFFADGTNRYGEAGGLPRSNAGWINLTPRQLTLPPHDAGTFYYTIQVPQKENLAGTYWSLVLVEPIPASALNPLPGEAGKVTMGIQTVMRYGIQLITDIGQTGTRSLRFAGQRLTAQSDRRALALDIENDGERVLTPLVWAELYDAQGAPLGRVEGGKQRLYPGCSGRFRLDLTTWPAGAYSALIVADNGDDNVFGTQYKLVLP